MPLQIKLETPNDYKEIEHITREAFWDIYKPWCDEHLVLHKLRNTSAFIPELDFVASIDDKLVGNIVYSKAKIINDNGIENELLCMGPLSVLPSYQKQWIGSELIKYSTKKAKELWYKGVIIFGDPDYYHRFWYQNAANYNITTADGHNLDPFMALELYENSLKDISWKFYADSVFETDKDELEEFEKQFPYKEKHITDTQLKM